MLLARSKLANQAFYFRGKPIYCTQFHPELDRATLLDLLRKYPKYVRTITGMSYDEFVATSTGESRHTDELLPRFVRHVMGQARRI